MTITLTPSQEQAIERAIRAGLVQSVDEFIETAVKALPRPEGAFNATVAGEAVARIRELRKSLTLDRSHMTFRKMAHIGHKY